MNQKSNSPLPYSNVSIQGGNVKHRFSNQSAVFRSRSDRNFDGQPNIREITFLLAGGR